MRLAWCLTKIVMWLHVIFIPTVVAGYMGVVLLAKRPLDSMGWTRDVLYLVTCGVMLLWAVGVVLHDVLKGQGKLERLDERHMQRLVRVMLWGGGSAVLWWVMFIVVCVGNSSYAVIYMLAYVVILLWLPTWGIALRMFYKSRLISREIGSRIGYCDSCGYDLRGTLEAGREMCPECGVMYGVEV